MPLTKTGEKIKRRFRKEYGKARGTSIFYAYMNEHPRITNKWHRKVKRRRK